jgi:hypothetical protein
MEKGIQVIVKRITQYTDSLQIDTKQPIELDEKELKKYVDLVVREIKKENEH